MIKISTKQVGPIFVLAGLSLVISFFQDLYTLILTSYISMISVLICYAFRRSSSSESNIESYETDVILAFFALAFGLLKLLVDENVELALKLIIFSGACLCLGLVFRGFIKSNMLANTQELRKVESWDVFSESQTEAISAMDGNVVSETAIINKVGEKLPYDDALKLMRTLRNEGKNPHAESSRQYEGLAPIMDFNGQFVKFKYENDSSDMPFIIKDK